MLSFKTVINVNGVTPKRIINFFLHLDTPGYKKWHPGHVSWTVLERDAKGLPKALAIEEYIGEYHFNETFDLIKYIPNELMLLKVRHKPPIESFLSLSFKQLKGYTEVTHELSFTYGFKPLDWFMDKLGFFNKFKKAVDKHATEEFTNLKAILKGGSND